jgi:hypothetical protein
MANFADALMQGMIAQMDPNVSMQREAMSGFIEVQRDNVKVAKGGHVAKLTEQLIELKKNGFGDDSVPVVAINKLIHSFSE